MTEINVDAAVVAVRDYALEQECPTAYVVAYGAAVAAQLGHPITDPLIAAAQSELGEEAVQHVAAWVADALPHIRRAADVLTQLEELDLSAGAIPELALPYRRAAQAVALATGKSVAQAAWAGAAAVCRAARLYAGVADLAGAITAGDPVARAAHLQVPDTELIAVATWTGQHWAEIDTVVGSGEMPAADHP
ncbi:hypothetical protein ACM0CQ_15825 [Mycobacteroides abscessus subsp. abscessus]|uniref:hypothetical protein n=1 Tax=Mycobacteroides abscessus TaxID=36809 RepID=UPI0039F03021